MKKFFGFWILLLAVTVTACSDKQKDIDPDAPRPTFSSVESDEENANTAWLLSEFSYAGTAQITEVGFAYKQESTSSYTSVKCAESDWSQTGALYQLQELKPDTEYRFYCYVIVGGEEYNSISKRFTTAPEGSQPEEPKPVFTAPASSNYTTTGASLSCAYAYSGDKSVSAAGFSYKKITDADYTQVTATGTTSPISYALTDLSVGTGYLFYAFVIVDGKTYNSSEATFSTQNEAGEVLPVFGTPFSYSVLQTSATIACNLAYNGTETISEVGFQYKASSDGSYTKTVLTATIGDKSAPLTGLTASTAYTFYLYAVIGGKTYQSAAGNFTTQTQSGGQEGIYRTGWPELAVESKNSDYYYAHHICPDFKVAGAPARNFTVCYSADNHCPVWVAAPLHNCYVGGNGDRKYGPDQIIPKNIQPSFRTVGSPYNKGHVLGNRERSGTSGMNKQVSYYTNMAPQHATTFNDGGGAWNNLEDHIDNVWCNDTLYMVSGCYFKTWTDSYGNTAQPKRTTFGGVDPSVPTMFFYVLLRTKNGNTGKSVMQCSASELQCVGFVMSHAMPKGHKPSRQDMRSVKEIEEIMGLTFFTNVPNAPKESYNASDWLL